MLKFARVFSSGIILQRGKNFNVWGWANGNVRVSLLCGRRLVQAANCAPDENEGGRFCAAFRAVDDCKNEYTVKAECGGESASFCAKFGNVYLALGQSNMSYSLGSVEKCDEIFSRAAKSEVAFLCIGEKPFNDISEVTRPVYPERDLADCYPWLAGSDERIKGVSAIAVGAAAELYEKTGVPTAFIVAAMGGLSIETYLPRGILEQDSELLKFTRRAGRYQSVEDYNKAGGRNYTQLAGVYNEKIAPLIGLNFSGTVWYLGESSAWDYEFACMFERALKKVVIEYSRLFGENFVAVGIAPEYYPYGDTYGYLYVNEALADLEKDFANYVFVPVHDIEPRWLREDGETYYHPIHPVNKLPVALRVADALINKTRYPRIESVKFSDGKAVCCVSGAPSGLAGGRAYGFTLAGENGKYYTAEAHVSGNAVTVKSADVPRPAAVTYAFKQYQSECNVCTESGLPLLPYRTAREAVNEKYCFTPAYAELVKNTVTENCFGCDVGTCRKVSVYKSGELYGNASVDICVADGVLTARAEPDNSNFFKFSVAAAICLSGHKSHLADYDFLNMEICAESGDVTFYGVAVRAADGSVYKFMLSNGGKEESFLPLRSEYKKYSAVLTAGQRGDGVRTEFSPDMRKSFVQMEFVFGSKTPACVKMRSLALSDKDGSQKIEKRIIAAAGRADTKLPD